VNFFQPTIKLMHKERHVTKVKKLYNVTETSYMRLLESLDVHEYVKMQLQKTFDELNPAALKREIDRLLMRLTKAYLKKKPNFEQQDKEPIHTQNFL